MLTCATSEPLDEKWIAMRRLGAQKQSTFPSGFCREQGKSGLGAIRSNHFPPFLVPKGLAATQVLPRLLLISKLELITRMDLLLDDKQARKAVPHEASSLQ